MIGRTICLSPSITGSLQPTSLKVGEHYQRSQLVNQTSKEAGQEKSNISSNKKTSIAIRCFSFREIYSPVLIYSDASAFKLITLWATIVVFKRTVTSFAGHHTSSVFFIVKWQGNFLPEDILYMWNNIFKNA